MDINCDSHIIIAYSGFWFYIIRPGGNMVCCDGEVWNISLRSCQRK